MTKWISVKDRLPEINEKVLICTSIGDQFVAWRESEKDPIDRDWRFSECCGCSVTAIFTHWMPLPEMPNEA